MKILIAGDWHSELHEEAMFRAFQELGHEPIRFAWHHYFKISPQSSNLNLVITKFQGKYMFGPIVDKLNNDLIQKTLEEQPDILFIYRGSHIYPSTLKKIKTISKNTKLLGYNNDDPFSPQYPKWKWRYFLAGVPEYDLVFAYRLHNIPELKASGAKQVELLRSWFIPSMNYPALLDEQDKKDYECDIVFIGHYEKDFRLACLEEIVKAGWKLNLFGHDYGWHPVLKKSDVLSKLMPIKNVWGTDYNKALSGATASLCFLSKLNRDTYTRRCFEIPASGSMLIAEYTDDLTTLFQEEKEAVFFRSPDDLVNKLEIYLNNKQLCSDIAKAGLERVHRDGHDIFSRMKVVLEAIDKI